jgi:hypothetical protein
MYLICVEQGHVITLLRRKVSPLALRLAPGIGRGQEHILDLMIGLGSVSVSKKRSDSYTQNLSIYFPPRGLTNWCLILVLTTVPTSPTYFSLEVRIKRVLQNAEFAYLFKIEITDAISDTKVFDG